MTLAETAWVGISILMLSACGGPASQNDLVLSSDATLASLTSSSGTLGPDFRSAVHDYDVVVNRLVNSIVITPITSHSSATLTVDGKRLASGNASSSIPLDYGSNSITLLVTAEDGDTMGMYTLAIFRMQL